MSKKIILRAGLRLLADSIMQKEDTKFDVAVIGGGPAGIMASCIAAKSGVKVVLLEKNKQLGRKLLLTGNGRCNITNAEFNLRGLVKNYNNGEFLFHAFSVFGPAETIKFFETLEVKTKIESGNKVFPASNNAKEILEALNKCLANNKVKIIFDSEVVDIKKTGKKISKIILKDGEIVAKKYILCAGGKSYPLTGSDGLGYKLAEKLGHTIVKLQPALSAIKLRETWVKDLQGISLKDINVGVFQNGKKQFHEEGEIMFTHFGISGPAAFNISGKVGDLLDKNNVKIRIDLFPLLNHEHLYAGFEDTLKKYSNRTIKNIISIFVQERFAEIFLDVLKIDKSKIANSMPRLERIAVVKALKNFEVTPESILGFDNAMVTRGGISLDEIDHKTMQSKIISNLFFAGEIIDVDGKTGGFNLQLCWSTGYLSGKSAAG